jgi:signal peptidase I
MRTGTAVSMVTFVAGVSCWVRRNFVAVTIHGSSMEPTYHDGDQVIVRCSGGASCRYSDVVVFLNPQTETLDSETSQPRWLVKRVVAVPGDRLPEYMLSCPDSTASSVPEGFFAVQGDSPRSVDSRHFGLVSDADILGVVWLLREQVVRLMR